MVELDNRISWVDIVAIGGMILTGALVFFDVKEDVALNAQKIKTVELELSEQITRVEQKADKDREEILDAVNETRKESMIGRQRIEDKLDRLIQRMLDENQ